MNKIVILFVAMFAGACIIESDHPPVSRKHEIYECWTYYYCDGYAVYDDFDTCSTLSESYDIVDDFIYWCSDDAYYNCYTYECSADCYSTDQICRPY